MVILIGESLIFVPFFPANGSLPVLIAAGIVSKTALALSTVNATLGRSIFEPCPI